jgi:hypothetical protein
VVTSKLTRLTGRDSIANATLELDEVYPTWLTRTTGERS